jgi:hypothetical protein
MRKTKTLIALWQCGLRELISPQNFQVLRKALMHTCFMFPEPNMGGTSINSY